MIEKLNRVNPKVSDLMRVASGHATLTPQDVIAAIPPTVFGRLLLYFSQQRTPDTRLKGLIVDKCIKHYNLSKRQMRWTKRQQSMNRNDITIMVSLSLYAYVSSNDITTRELAKSLKVATMTCHDNHQKIYNHVVSFMIAELNAAIAKTLLRLNIS